MSQIKWSAFPSGTTPAGADIAVGLQGGANVQWTMTQLAAFFENAAGITINTSPIAGGSSGRFLYDNAATIGETNGMSWNSSTQAMSLATAANATPITVSGYSLTGANAQPLMSLAGTWNTSGTPTAILLNMLNTASNNASMLMDLQVGGSEIFGVNVLGQFGTPNVGGGLNMQFLSNQIFINYFGTPRGAWTDGLGFVSCANKGFAWTSNSNDVSSGADTFLSRGGAAATVQLGQSDAAAPVAQTLQVQSVVAGTTNTAGVDWTFAGSRGTGTGAGGKIVLQYAFAGSTGTSQNALTACATFDPVNGISFNSPNGGGSATYFFKENGVAVLQIAGANLEIQGTQQYSFSPGGAPLGDIAIRRSSATQLEVNNRTGGTYRDFLARTFFINGTDTQINRAAAATLQFGAADAASPIAQTLQVQSVVTGTTNTAGVDWTMKASASTGNAAGGRFVWQLTRLGASGTSQNAFSNGMTLDVSNGNYNWTVGSGSNGTGNINLFGASGASWGDISFFSDAGTASKRALLMGGDATGMTVAADWTYKWGSNAANAGDVLTPDTTLSRLSANCVKSAGAWASSAPNTQSGTTYTMVAADSAIIFTNAGACTLTLLSASANTGRILWVKDTNATGTVVSASSNVVPQAGGAAGTAILAAGGTKWAMLRSDGTNWIVMASN